VSEHLVFGDFFKVFSETPFWKMLKRLPSKIDVLWLVAALWVILTHREGFVDFFSGVGKDLCVVFLVCACGVVLLPPIHLSFSTIVLLFFDGHRRFPPITCISPFCDLQVVCDLPRQFLLWLHTVRLNFWVVNSTFWVSF
jgi:hypothetical protein